MLIFPCPVCGTPMQNHVETSKDDCGEKIVWSYQCPRCSSATINPTNWIYAEHYLGSDGSDIPRNRADIDEICELRDRVENLTLYLREALALCPDELAVLDEWHPGLPGYAPPQGCKSCKIDD